MAITQKERRTIPKIESPGLFLIIVIFLLISLSVLILGLLNWKKEKTTQREQPEVTREGTSEDNSLSNYFKKKSTDAKDIEKPDEFLLTDPFREVCASTAGDGLPSISGSTVCLR